MSYLLHFSSTYNCGAYGASTYNGASTGCGTTTTTTTTPASGTLANTGFIVLVVATIAATIIFAALVVKLWRKPKKHSAEV